MLVPTRSEDQVTAACGDRLRVLVVGAGIAGLSAAQLLRRRICIRCCWSARPQGSTCWD